VATTFCDKKPVVTQGSEDGQDILYQTDQTQYQPSKVGSRTVQKDAYRFVVGSQAHLQAMFQDGDKSIQVDVGTKPTAEIFANGVFVDSIEGELSSGQVYEYSFYWNVPADADISARYNVKYTGQYGGTLFVWGTEFFVVAGAPTNIKLKVPAYATVDEVRKDKANIDSYLPPDLRENKAARDELIHHHLVTATKELNGQLNLRDFHYEYNDNFNLYTRYYAIWSILGSMAGEEGQATSERTLDRWEKRWRHVLKQIKMHSQLSNIPTGRS